MSLTIVVGVFSPSAAWTLPRACVAQLRRDFPQHTFVDVWDRDALRRAFPEADVAFAAYVERDLPATLTRTRWIQVPAAGVGHVLSADLIASPITVTSARGVRARAVAEHVMAVTLALARQLHVAVRRQSAHVWAMDELEVGGAIRTLRGKRITIVGLGSIGSEVAKVASPFGMNVSAVRRRPGQPASEGVDEVVGPDGMLDLLARSDVVVLSAASTPETRNLFGERAFDAIKRGALLVNIGRGSLVDDRALVAALSDGRLGGAALDVFTREPLDAASPYWDLPNVIITPHVSGAMEDYWTPLVALFSENLRRFEAGQSLVNVVDKAAGY
jgi:phosphoglycerate dehydrogenase-like enzyme